MAAAADPPLSLYIQSVEAEAQLEICAGPSVGMGADFGRAFRAWRAAHAAALAEGAAMAAQQGMTGEARPSIQSFARMNAQTLASLPLDDRQRRCNELLAFFRGHTAR
ncbi:MAG: hypothetical protein O9331_06170 [Acidovorax sp.]|nr:hypothetical protein [Acidovorax sp.]